MNAQKETYNSNGVIEEKIKKNDFVYKRKMANTRKRAYCIFN